MCGRTKLVQCCEEDYARTNTVDTLGPQQVPEAGHREPAPVGGQDESWEGAVIVNSDCTRLKESQLRFSPVEAKATALDFAISCCSYWISYCPQVELYSN